jgi:hypothetical protein
MELLRKRRFWLAAGLVTAGLLAVAAYAFPPYPSPLNLVFDILALFGSLLAGLLIISQIVLPVQTPAERRAAFDHFVNYVSGRAGPIVFVRDGKMVGRKEELKRYGHGVALVDAVSAIVFERAAASQTWFPAATHNGDAAQAPKPNAGGTAIVRAAGPGIAFIQPGERVVATLDLRKQSRGAPAKGLTRDGIEVTAPISVTFGLDPDLEPLGRVSPPAERREPDQRFAYQFNRTSAFYAVYGVALGEKQPVEWTDLPLTVAVECFRNKLAEKKLDALFKPTVPQSDPSESDPFAEFRNSVVEAVKSAQVLRERGIVVYGVGVGSLEMPREVVNQRVRSWRTPWQKLAIHQEAAQERQLMLALSKMQAETQTLIVEHIQNLLGGTADALDRRVLTRMLEKALRRAAANPAHRARLPAETLRTIENLGEAKS